MLLHGKAPGIDQVTAETDRSCVLPASDVIHQLFIKIFLQGAGPLQWKGGELHVIPDRQTYSLRMPCGGMMLLTACGKLFHALLRKMLLPWTTRMRRPAQVGGFVDSKPTLLHICSALSVSMLHEQECRLECSSSM